MLWLIVLLLAIVQGITEFLPVSSSGHLVVLQELCKQWGHPLPEQEILVIDVALHVGTLLAVLVFFWKRILEVILHDRRIIGLLIVGSIPAGIVGITLKKQIEAIFENPLAVGCFFFVTGIMLLLAERRKTGEITCQKLSYARALVVGLFQALAILPGISRSGSTIAAGLGVGMERKEAAVFSFLLAIPAIAGAGVLEGAKRLKTPPEPMFALVLGFGVLVSFLVGLLALWWLIRWLQQGRLHWFAWWVFILGGIVIFWQIALQ